MAAFIPKSSRQDFEMAAKSDELKPPVTSGWTAKEVGEQLLILMVAAALILILFRIFTSTRRIEDSATIPVDPREPRTITITFVPVMPLSEYASRNPGQAAGRNRPVAPEQVSVAASAA